MSSVSLVICTGSTEVLSMVSVKTKSPPGSAKVVGTADFVSATVGQTSSTVTVSSSVAVAVLVSLSSTVTEAVLS